eukprot:TRINITY_DN1181_c0_g1_i1.p1 TRINITY_DN1181_c0_g1~~TRINITY_DN1181_c0_g1_i1.p1  ORF type:complete len:423 (+),score=92.84 TRINITY_DN1181_c0_g1_i1:70-1338(+)
MMQEQQAFIDMESLSETDAIVEVSLAPGQSRRSQPAFFKFALPAAVLIGLGLAFAVSSSAPRAQAPKSSGSDFVNLNLDESVWADVLGDTAMKQMEAMTDEVEKTGLLVSTTDIPHTENSEVVPSATEAEEMLAATSEATETTQSLQTSQASESTEAAATEAAAPAPMAEAATIMPAPSAPAGDASELSSNLASLASRMQAAAAGVDASSPQYKQYTKISQLLKHALQTAQPSTPAAPMLVNLPVDGMIGATTQNPADSLYAPKMHIGDGNPCPDDEEQSGGLCFKKCSDLTGGTHPIRTSAFSCCRSEPCGFSNTLTHMGMCFGYDVAADSQASRCPQSPGACLTNEEEFSGMCYKKCSELTNGEYNNRVAAATCCKKTGWECFLFTNIKTDASFTEGGGAGDHNSGTPREGHPVMTALTR